MKSSFGSPLIADVVRRAQEGSCGNFFKDSDNQNRIVAGLRDAAQLNEQLQNARRVDQDLLMRQISV